MRTKITTLILVSLVLYLVSAAAAAGGSWNQIQKSIGASAMHMQLLHNDKVIIFDRTDFGKSNLSLLPYYTCRDDPTDTALKHDCTAHSVEYDVIANTFRPLKILTDTWCSSGTVSPDGTLIQTGGFNDGERNARAFAPCDDASCDWLEVGNALLVRRWYATNQILPDGTAFILGGRQEFNYEFYPAKTTSPINFPFLRQTFDPEENNLYPFVHLNVDGKLFIFSNNRAILFDYKKNVVTRQFPVLPGGDPRNYPSSGSSVPLPINAMAAEAEVLVCGGAPKGSYNSVKNNNTYVGALATCGRIKITDPLAKWTVETMPMGRVMGDMVLLPDGKVVIINGAAVGTAGWEYAKSPVLTPVVYSPNAPAGARFVAQSSATTPRMYHSSAVLLRDGRVLVGGSNPHVGYKFFGVEFPTELSLDAFSPEYLSPLVSSFRPKIVTQNLVLSYGGKFSLLFTVTDFRGHGFTVTMVAPAFSTHSFSMNQRLLVLENGTVTKSAKEGYYTVSVSAPVSEVYAPAGYYMVFVVNEGVPSEGIWAHIQ